MAGASGKLRKIAKRTVPVWFVAMAFVAAVAMVGIAIMAVYTSVPVSFEVEKSIVVDGEQYENGTYALPLNLGTLYQGENYTTALKLVNKAKVPIQVAVKCDDVRLIYKSGYKLTKSLENASRDWGIDVDISPGGTVIVPAKGRVQVSIVIQVAFSAQPASSGNTKYSGYEMGLTVEPMG